MEKQTVQEWTFTRTLKKLDRGMCKQCKCATFVASIYFLLTVFTPKRVKPLLEPIPAVTGRGGICTICVYKRRILTTITRLLQQKLIFYLCHLCCSLFSAGH